MIARWALLALLPVIAGISLFQRRRLSAIIGMGLFSFTLAAVYLLYHAPDVAITEATIGAALVTAIYVLAIRRTGRLVVVADEAPGLIAREEGRLVGIEYEILDGFARHLGLDLTVRFVPQADVARLLDAGEADIAAGGIIPTHGAATATSSHLETAVYRMPETPLRKRNPWQAPDYEGDYRQLLQRNRQLLPDIRTLDLARVVALTRAGVPLQDMERVEGDFGYAFLVPRGRLEQAAELNRYLDSLREDGELERIIERNLV